LTRSTALYCASSHSPRAPTRSIAPPIAPNCPTATARVKAGPAGSLRCCALWFVLRPCALRCCAPCGPPMACCCARWPAALPPCRAALWPV